MYLDKEVIKKCNENFVTLEEMVYLYSKVTDSDYGVELTIPSLSKLQRQGYLSGAQMTQQGAELVSYVFGTNPVVDKEYSKEFEAFWKLYPANDGIGGVVTKKLKGSKVLSYTRYKQALARGYSDEEIYQGLVNHIAFLNSTLTTRKNPFTYMKACHNWLDSNEFLEYHEVEETKQRSKLWK